MHHSARYNAHKLNTEQQHSIKECSPHTIDRNRMNKQVTMSPNIHISRKERRQQGKSRG